jgi:hypothetical protein
MVCETGIALSAADPGMWVGREILIEYEPTPRSNIFVRSVVSVCTRLGGRRATSGSGPDPRYVKRVEERGTASPRELRSSKLSSNTAAVRPSDTSPEPTFLIDTLSGISSPTLNEVRGIEMPTSRSPLRRPHNIFPGSGRSSGPESARDGGVTQVSNKLNSAGPITLKFMAILLSTVVSCTERPAPGCVQYRSPSRQSCADAIGGRRNGRGASCSAPNIGRCLRRSTVPVPGKVSERDPDAAPTTRPRITVS